MAFGGDERVDREGRRSAQDRADIVRIGDLVEDNDEAIHWQLGNVDRRKRPRLEQHALMHRLARRAARDLLKAHDPHFDPARGDLGLKPSAAAAVA